jgi:signal transduction histidine kinase
MADKKTILYIEDDPGSQILVQRTLAFAGYRVVVASCGIEGIDTAAREMPDMILMDINLPDLSGREVTTKLRGDERFRGVPIVALTALSQAGEREKAIAAGASGYLTKPIDVDRLPDQVAHYMAGARDIAEAGVLMEAHAAYNQEVVNRLEGKIRELESVNAELLRMDKIKDDFIQLTAHELRTPLTLVYGYSRLLQESSIVRRLKDESAEIKMFIDGLVDSIERMSAVINEILTVSRITTGRIDLSLGPTNLAEIAEHVVESFAQASQQRNLLINFNPAQWPQLIHADADLIALALSNVVGNAIKYTPDGGVVNLIARPGVTNVVLMFQDTGIGISKEDQARIFERFYTAGDTQLHSTSKTAFRGGGLGLGLAISKGIVEAHGGRIWVESEGRDEERLPGTTCRSRRASTAHAALRQREKGR